MDRNILSIALFECLRYWSQKNVVSCFAVGIAVWVITEKCAIE